MKDGWVGLVFLFFFPVLMGETSLFEAGTLFCICVERNVLMQVVIFGKTRCGDDLKDDWRSIFFTFLLLLPLLLLLILLHPPLPLPLFIILFILLSFVFLF